MKKTVLVTYPPNEAEKEIIREVLNDIADIQFLADSAGNERTDLLAGADIIVALSFSPKEIAPAEVSRLGKVQFIQLVYAGADHLPFAQLPADILLAGNTGAFAEPLAEHVLALTLALAKNLLPRHKLLCEGRFDRSGYNRNLKGGICAILGMGGNGTKIAEIMRAAGMKVYGINRRGLSECPLDFMGTVADMQHVLQVSDVVVVTVPLTRETRHLLGKKELEWMKPDAILINVGRGDVIDQQALFSHLTSNPGFLAGIDTWWSEPIEGQDYTLDYPFCDLPNFIGSPHVADHVPGMLPVATGQALQNVKNYLLGKDIRGVLNRSDYLP